MVAGYYVPNRPLGDALASAYPHHTPPLLREGDPVPVSPDKLPVSCSWDATLLDGDAERAAVRVDYYPPSFQAHDAATVELRRVHGGNWTVVFVNPSPDGWLESEWPFDLQLVRTSEAARSNIGVSTR